uniref:Putative double-stranded RNA-binding protein 2-like isoform X1 n=1 Tax=Davidia involucrata TaxID=16924 RepID=A0A5B6ZMQ6_DAVIN
MYKNQLQELAQRSCFNLPSYTCIREGPDHAPRFKATVNFNGETFESPNYCTTLRQAEHSAAEVALNALASRGPTHSLAAKILDETGVYKNLLQEVSQRVGASLPTYTTFRSGLGHLPVFTCTVELAGITFTGEPAKNKKQAEKNAAMAAWSSLKILAQQSENLSLEKVNNDEQEHVTVARALLIYLMKAKMSNLSFPIKFPIQNPRPSSAQPPPVTVSKILPLIRTKTVPRSRPVITPVNNSPVCPKTAPQNRPVTTANDRPICPKTGSHSQHVITTVNDIPLPSSESPRVQPQKFPAAGAAPYIPIRHFRAHHGIAPPVTIRNAIPVFSAPPLPPPSRPPQLRQPPSLGIAPPVCIRQVVPVFAAPPVRVEESSASVPSSTPPGSSSKASSVQIDKTESAFQEKLPEAVVIQDLQELKI